MYMYFIISYIFPPKLTEITVYYIIQVFVIQEVLSKIIILLIAASIHFGCDDNQFNIIMFSMICYTTAF